jgi:ryanodine receptor 2
MGNEGFGKICNVGDVVGVMIDLKDKTISFSLNGELLLDAVGSESAFENINSNEGYVPSFTLFSGQKIKLNFGQDVNSLRYFTNCGLQESYEPFAVNMTKSITFWYSNEIPIFDLVEDNNESLEVHFNASSGQSSNPTIKVISKIYGNSFTRMEYLRLSLPITFNSEFVSKSVLRDKRNQALSMYKSQIEEENVDRYSQNQFNFDPPDRYSDMKNNMDETMRDSSSNINSSSNPLKSIFGKGNKNQNPNNNSRAKSPFKILNKLSSREVSPTNFSTQNKPQSKTNSKIVPSKSKISRSSEFGIKTDVSSNNLNPSSQQMKYVEQKRNSNFEDPTAAAGFSESDSMRNNVISETDDLELQAIVDYVDDYYYGIRIFPGQDLTKTFVGWTSSRFHLLSDKTNGGLFNSSLVSQCTMINTTADGSIISK